MIQETVKAIRIPRTNVDKYDGYIWLIVKIHYVFLRPHPNPQSPPDILMFIVVDS